MLMFVITMLVILVLSGLVLLAVAQGEGKLESLLAGRQRPSGDDAFEEAEPSERVITRV